MTPGQLLAQAADADRQADAIFAQMDAATDSLPADVFGCRPLIPAGFADRAQKACDLRREARYLRQAAEEATPRPAPRASAPLALAPPSPTICMVTAATPPEPKPDPIEAIVARIMEA